jgi:hypothetical protein
VYVIFDGFSHHVLPSMTKEEIFVSMDEYGSVVINANTIQVVAKKGFM